MLTEYSSIPLRLQSFIVTVQLSPEASDNVSLANKLADAVAFTEHVGKIDVFVLPSPVTKEDIQGTVMDSTEDPIDIDLS